MQQEKILSLLQASALPFSDILWENTHFWTAHRGAEMLGCIGLEKYGNKGLLRSFAVEPGSRNKGIGGKLLQQLLEAAPGLELQEIYLLTTTAEAYFSQKGFSPINRADTPDAIKLTSEFSSVCPSSAVVMYKYC